jgi:RHS repeat-associated protein
LHPFKYCGIFGYREDEETGLMKVGARYFDTKIGRWIQKDPILDGFNWWVYCDNDPVNYVDPKGLIKCPYCGEDVPDNQYYNHHCYRPHPVFNPQPPQGLPADYIPPASWGGSSSPPFLEAFKEFITSLIESLKSLFRHPFSFGGGSSGGRGATGEW